MSMLQRLLQSCWLAAAHPCSFYSKCAWAQSAGKRSQSGKELQFMCLMTWRCSILSGILLAASEQFTALQWLK